LTAKIPQADQGLPGRCLPRPTGPVSTKSLSRAKECLWRLTPTHWRLSPGLWQRQVTEGFEVRHGGKIEIGSIHWPAGLPQPQRPVPEQFFKHPACRSLRDSSAPGTRACLVSLAKGLQAGGIDPGVGLDRGEGKAIVLQLPLSIELQGRLKQGGSLLACDKAGRLARAG